MTAAELRSDHLLPPAWKPSHEVGWWAMVLIIATEAMLFASPSLAFVLTFVLNGAAAPTLAQPAPPRAVVPVTPAAACTSSPRPPAAPCR